MVLAANSELVSNDSWHLPTKSTDTLLQAVRVLCHLLSHECICWGECCSLTEYVSSQNI